MIIRKHTWTPALSAGFAIVAGSAAATVTLAPSAGTTNNVLSLFTGDTSVEIVGPGAVRLNNANSHTGGTTLSGGTLILSGGISAGGRSPVGAGTFTVAGGTLLGSGTFGGDIVGTGAFTNLATGGWVWTGDNSFAEPVTLADGALEIAGGSTTFGKHFYVGAGGADVAFTMSGGSVAMNANNVQLSYGKYAKSSFTMTGGSFDVNGKNVVTGYSSTYATNTFDVSGDAVFYNANQVYSYTGNGNVMDINIHDGGTLGFKLLKRGSDNKNTAQAYLCVNGGVLRNEMTGSSATTFFKWIGGTTDSKNQLTSFMIGPKGATFTTDNGDAAGIAQIYSPITAVPASAGETPAGVTFSGGRFAYYVETDYEGPTVIKDGATLYLSTAGTIPSGSAVTIKTGSMLRIPAVDKTVASLTLEDGAALGFGTPSSGANATALTVSGDVSLPESAQIGLYTLNTPAGVAKNDNGTYAVLNVPAAYAAALRAVRWSCATIVEGKSATFAVAESGGTATLSVTIADSDAATTSGDISVGPGEYISLDGSLNVKSRTVTVDGGYLKIGASLTETSGNGAVYVENGGLLDVYNYVRFSNDANSRYDLYVRNGGIVRALLFSPPSGVTVADLTNVLHMDGGTLQLVAPRDSDYSDNNRQNPYKISVLVGAGGATFDLSHWADRDRTGWFRFTAENLEFNHDPGCAGTDGGITVCGSNGDTIIYYFKSLGNSTMNGGVTVADGGIISTVSGLTEQTVRIQPGGMFRGYNASNGAVINNLVLGEVNAVKPVEIVVCKDSIIPTLVVTNTLSVLSPVAINVAQQWNRDSSLVSGVYTALVYQAVSPALDTSLFRLPTGYSGSLSAETVALTSGDYAGYMALVVTIDNDIAVTGATEYPTPLTVSSDRSCGRIVVGGAWNGVADPVCDTSLTVSGNVTASDALYLGYDPALGANAETGWHKGFLTLNAGSITTPAVYSIYRPGYGSGNSDCRFGCEATVNGGVLDVAGDVRFGNSRSKYGDNLYSRLTVNGGRVAVGGMFYLLYCNTSGAYSAPGSIVLNDGAVDVTGLIDLSRNVQRRDDSTAYTEKFGIWLNGGVLKAENIMMSVNALSPKIVFNGGTYAPYGADAANRTMQNLNKCYVSTNGAVVSTENLPADAVYTIAQPLLQDPSGVDGGLRKIGVGTLALSGANTYTGVTEVASGTLVVASAEALSARVSVADGAALDLDGQSVALAGIDASGAVQNGSLTVTNALFLGASGSILSVDGDVALDGRVVIDFGLAPDATPDIAWRPVLAASGSISVPANVHIGGCGGKYNRCATMVQDGVLYVRPTSVGLVIYLQ